MTEGLAGRQCEPCKGDVSPMQRGEILVMLDELRGGWKVPEDHHLEKVYKFKDFAEALDFTNIVGGIAEEQGHHPDIHLAWGKVKVTVWTHKIDGLTESDLVFAAKVEETHESLETGR
jgi:4a-hydroxytetrahydrobiopterin dehydratase